MKKTFRRHRISGAELAWSMKDEEVLQYAFMLLRERYSNTTLALIVENQTNDVLARILKKLS